MTLRDACQGPFSMISLFDDGQSELLVGAAKGSYGTASIAMQFLFG